MKIKVIKFVLFFGAIFLFLYLLFLDFVPGKNLIITYNFCKQNPMTTELSPGDRLFEIEKNQNQCWQRIAKSPIYFDVRSPQVFKNVKVEIKYKNLRKEKFQIGPQVEKNSWTWLLKDVLESDKVGEWQIAKIDFDLANVYQGSNVMRWLISAPAIEANKQTITISSIKLVFEKDKLNFNNFWEHVRGYLRKIKR